jgi:hypothetical protein
MCAMFDEICLQAFNQGVSKLAADCHSGRIVLPENPLGNGLIIPADDVGVFKRLLRSALRSRRWFGEFGPHWGVPLPLNAHERSVLRDSGCWRLRLVSEFAWSLQGRDYSYHAHPAFYDYCCGRTAARAYRSPWLVEDGIAFPPKQLDGLDAAGRWKPFPDRGSKMLELQPV